jgi:hypothetical protein
MSQWTQVGYLTVLTHSLKALSIAKNQTFRLSESDFTISQSSEGVWFYTFCPGRSTFWTQILGSEFCSNPWESEASFYFCRSWRGPLGRPYLSSSYVFVTLKVLYNVTLCCVLKNSSSHPEHAPARPRSRRRQCLTDIDHTAPVHPQLCYSPWRLPLNCTLLSFNHLKNSPPLRISLSDTASYSKLCPWTAILCLCYLA